MAIEAIDKAVRKVMEVAKVTMISVPIRPTLPTTHPNRRYIITPNTVSMEGVNTPPKVFNLPPVWVVSFLITVRFNLIGCKYTVFILKHYIYSVIYFYNNKIIYIIPV